MANKVTIFRQNTGRKYWVVSRREAGKRKRSFFVTETAAKAEAGFLREQISNAGEVWFSLSAKDRNSLIAAYNEARKRGIDIMSLIHRAELSVPSAASPACKDVADEIVTVKTKSGLSSPYMSSLRQILGSFCKGRERMAMNKIVFADVEAFIDRHNLNSRSTMRSRLATWFKFAVRRGYCQANLCERLEPVKVIRKPPRILSLDETRKLLQWFKNNPRAFAWFVLTTFCGLRPEEAMKTRKSEINFAESWVRVEAQTSKITERRVVYPRPEAMALLKRAIKPGQLPLTKKQLREERLQFRAAVGLKTWPQDITRHTAASMWLAVSEAKAVAGQLGHSERVLHRNYKALATRNVALEFWKLAEF